MPKVPFWVFILVAILYFAAIRIDTMDVDASQYAEISREMLKSGDYLHIYDRGADYLDKPPFLFWVSSVSMKIFGVNNLGYKLPSILFALLAIYATYRLARLLYDDITARMAALVLATCQGMFLMTNDVRCDTILMAWTITAIWLIQEWVINKKLLFLLAGCAAIAFGMMTKGPIALMVPVFCFVSDWSLKREWSSFFKPAYILGIIIITLLLIPMSIGLYQQFDLHPEKLVNGKAGASGLRFFYWSQSFGRITGESPWKNGADISFLLVNMLWSFLPWIFLFITALVINVKALIQQKFRLQQGQEWISTGGFLLGYLALGSSSYQLPHYIFVAFPLAAIITARFLYQLIAEGAYPRLYRFMATFHVAIILLLLCASGALAWAFAAPIWAYMLWGIGIATWLGIGMYKPLFGKLLWLPAIGIFIVNIMMSGFIYPAILQYQAGSQVGRYLREKSIPVNEVGFYKMEDPLNSLHIYAHGVVSGIDTLGNLKGKKYVLTMQSRLREIRNSGLDYTVVGSGSFFKVSELTPEFINPKTREKAVKQYYLVKISR